MADSDREAHIRALLDRALQLRGPSIELAAIEASWGDTLDDEQMIEWLETFIDQGSGFEHDLEADDLEELEDEFQRGVKRH